MLVMGGQACVFYGAAEFSRDLDLLVLVDPENLERLRESLTLLSAKPIAVPPFHAAHLDSGHAIHFRCGADGVAGLRLKIMSSLRGVAQFAELWDRRTTIETAGEKIDLLALRDLVAAKKTQRGEDWSVIRRLMEQDYFSSDGKGSPVQLTDWMLELRTPELLINVVASHPEIALEVAKSRLAVSAALTGDIVAVSGALEQEEAAERQKDRLYWEPLKRELEMIRRNRT